MPKQLTTKQLETDWDHAAERAAQTPAPITELDAENLTSAAGLHVQAGIRSGLWGVTPKCSDDCSRICG